MRALFGRKVSNLAELHDLTAQAMKRGQKGQPYTIIREVVLDDEVFRAFVADFLEDQPWIEKTDGGSNEAGELRCIRVINKETGEKVLTDTQGYDYCRYVALEVDE